ncbi:MAG TPA: DUF937 domain-containing protein [Vicinamibacterales bacterium]
MNILESIIHAQDGAAVKQLGSQVGLAPDQTNAALAALVPALAAGFQRNMQNQGGLDSLLSALNSGSHGQYVDNPAILSQQTAVDDGNGILGHLLGSKEVSREVANRASAQTGINPAILKQLLPLAATLMMGAMAKRSASASAMPAGLGQSGGGLMDMLAPMLDQNRDGSIVDDVLGRLMRPK